MQKKYTKKEQRKLYDSIKRVKAYGGDLWSWIGSLFVSCTTQYFEYQNSVEELKVELDNNLWILNKAELKDCNDIQKRLLTSSWNLLRKYHLPDNYRLEQDSLNEFYNTLYNQDAQQRLRILKRIEKDFLVYPPYWIYRAQAAQEVKDKEEAKNCFDKFDEVWRPVLRKDPFKQVAAKFRISELTNRITPKNKEKIKEYLEVLENHSKRGEWFNNVFAGIVYYAINEKDKAIDRVQSNLDSNYEIEISKTLYEAFKSDNVDIKSLGEKIGLSIDYIILAEVLDTEITREDFECEFSNLKKVSNQEEIDKYSTKEGKQKFLRDLVDFTMFQKKAILEGLDKTQEYKNESRNAIIAALSIEHTKRIIDNKTAEEQVETYKKEIERLKDLYHFSFNTKAAEIIRKESLTDAEKNLILAKYDGGEIKVIEIYKVLEPYSTSERKLVLAGEGLNDFLNQHFARVLSQYDAEKNYDAYCKEYPRVVLATERRTLVKKLFDKILSSVKINDTEVKDFYNKNLSNFASPAPQIHAHHILVTNEQTAQTLLSNLKYNPSKFEEVARNNSVCPSKDNGGDLGYFNEGLMVPEFEEACKKAEIGKIAGPVKTQFGYHIIRVDNRIPASGTKPFDSVKEDIGNQLLPQKQKEIFDAYVESLRKEFKVKIYPENL